MSGTRKMDKFELEAFEKANAAPEEPVDSKTATAKVAKVELPPAALPTGGELEPQPSPEPLEAEEAYLPQEAVPRTQSHPPARPPSSSGPSFQQVREEPSIIVEKPPQPADPAALRTRLAKKFVSLADDVNEEFNEFSIGAGAWGVELTSPQGMSTGGGKQALQHLRMRPRRSGYSVLVGGTVNQVEKTAELRDYAHMCIMHEVRFRKRLEISQSEWEQFLRKAEVVLREAEMQCERVGPTKDLLAQRRGITRVSKIAAAAFVIVVVLAAIVLFRIATT